jgi:hypothetical protein
MTVRKLRRGSSSLYDLTNLEHVFCHDVPPFYDGTNCSVVGSSIDADPNVQRSPTRSLCPVMQGQLTQINPGSAVRHDCF